MLLLVCLRTGRLLGRTAVFLFVCCRGGFGRRILVLYLIVFVQEIALDLNSVGRLRSRRKIERISIKTVSLPDLVFDGIGYPDSQGFP